MWGERAGLAGCLAACWLCVQAQAAPPLVFCAEADADGFDSALSDTAATHRAAAYALYNRLVGFVPGSATLAPELAESWTSSSDGTVWTFVLRKQVVFQRTAWFSPSRPFNADDVLWSVQRQIDNRHPGAAQAPAGFPGALSGNWAELIRSVDKLDAYTVRFTLSKPYAPFPVLMASWPMSIVSAEYGDKLARSGQLAKLASEPVGTGPYQLVRYDKGSTIRYAAHPGYFRGKPAIDRLLFSITPDPAVRAQKLRSGECALAESLKPQDLAMLETAAGVSVYRYQPQVTSFLAFNTRKKPFDDARVRRALSLVIDRRAIVASVFGGQAEVGWFPYSGQALWGVPAAEKHDPKLDAARQLLREAGQLQGFDTTIWAAQGGGAANLNPKLTAELIQADWAKLGVRARIVLLDAAELSRKGRAGEHDTIVSGWRNSLDPDELYANLLSCESASNSTAHWCDEGFDKLIDAGRASPDRSKRAQAYEAAARRFAEAAPWAVLAYPGMAVAASSKLTGLAPGPAAPFAFERLRWK
ncbi:ABC transporter substrate-binding protein [Chitinimonas sp.]|uniref:ABC transporter substrate-binding protein n=1 Tax=Chitinimonas sp. TaxID=1934313 RepID=UPI0035B174E1